MLDQELPRLLPPGGPCASVNDLRPGYEEIGLTRAGLSRVLWSTRGQRMSEWQTAEDALAYLERAPQCLGSAVSLTPGRYSLGTAP